MFVAYAPLDNAARSFLLAMPTSWAPAAYRQRLDRKTHLHAKAQSIGGLWLLNHALKHVGYGDHAIADINLAQNGRPQLPTGPAFSISHSDDFVACAVTDTTDGARNVGLDIEQPRPIPPARLARLVSNDDERSAIKAEPARFFDYWCAREATVKATGHVGLKRIRQIRLDDKQAWLDEQCWTLYPLVLAPELTACMACDSPTETVRLQRVVLPT